MDKKFLEAVKFYLYIVENACNLLIDYIRNKEQIYIINKYDLYDYLHKKHVFEFVEGERKYCFHGKGCTVLINDKPMIDWDFGYRSCWCGVEPFKMALTLKSSSYKDFNYYDGKYIKKQCEQYLSEKKMYYYSGQYYIDLIKFNYKKIKFPIIYDKMIIEYNGISRSYPKCKSIDKFIKKSNVIYEKINYLKNNYTLVFYYQNNEIARIPYNDIAYPDAAVKIMNGEIIKPHIVKMWKK
ncbi:hypothetical protein SAMN02910289_01146 [Lachnospiraceae bacterium RM5]|nr:hypothetical protein SAMN02910289_01146 [Lachnospiraceae bacterium RM5]